MDKLSRREIREKAIQSLYQLVGVEDSFSAEAAITFALEAGNDPEAGYTDRPDAYLLHLVKGVRDNRVALDNMIADYLTTSWTIDRIAAIDLTILRLAFFEVVFVDDQIVPSKVAVDEAIELSKRFSDDKSRQFVSGVLAKLLKDNQEKEPDL